VRHIHTIEHPSPSHSAARIGKHYSCTADELLRGARSAREVVLVIEPALEIVELRSAAFREDAKAWFCLSRKRTIPAQPSTRHD